MNKLVKLSEHAGPDTRHLLVIGAFNLDYYPLCLKSVLLVKCFTINHIDYSDPANQCPALHRAVVQTSNVTKMAGKFHQVEVLDSSIISLSLTSGATRGVFTFFRVVIHELYQLIILGFCTFTLHSSRISTIHSGGLVVKSDSDSLHGINFSNISMVETEGILVERGELTLENVIINKLDFKSIIVNGSGVLILKNVVLKMAHPRGLVLAGGQINVINVTCNNILLSDGVFNSSSNTDITIFQLPDDVVPLTFIETTLGIILSLIIVFIIVGIVFCYCIWSKYVEPELLKPVAVV
ncbi:hypothetical protein Hamer_G014180 [Homarus americanus]|uniref:Uncharacterized protein n=1 Tax=Homarus americanus TaxID=6706 RepID=A0A8J5JT60_HOMAM|nr:hypothetical protein Hamer_G014180 [Homarus americanus]